MPYYQFSCRNESCTENNKVQTISMKMTEYTDEQYCHTCGNKMYRCVDDMVCAYKDCPGFYGRPAK